MVSLGTIIWTSAKPIIKFIILGGCGAIMARHGLLSPLGAKCVAGLILNYTLPALLFAKMLSCVSQENIHELGYVAIIAVVWMLMGGLFGLFIQRVCRVPKRIYWGIVAATMFTNFGDLPISIILAVSDHPPFLVGDGARGTAYSSVFIAVFYLFLFPFGGFRLIRYDHVKESKRIAAMNANHDQHILPLDDPQHGHEAHQMTVFSQSSHIHGAHGKGSPILQGHGLYSTFSSTSTMVSFDDRTDYGHHGSSCGASGLSKSISTQNMSTIPLDESPVHRSTNPFHDDPSTHSTHALDQYSSYSPSNASRSLRVHPASDASSFSVGGAPMGYPSQPTIQPPMPILVPPPVPVAMPTMAPQPQNPFGVPSSMQRYSVESNSSNLTRYSNHTHHDDDSGLIQSHHKRSPHIPGGGSGAGGAKGLSSSSSFRANAKKASLASIAAIRQATMASRAPTATTSPSTPATLVTAAGNSGGNGSSSDGSSSSPFPSSSLSPHDASYPGSDGSGASSFSPSSSSTPSISIVPSSSSPSTEPLPKVPPQLERSHNAKAKGRFWSTLFHTTREYLTPPTIGLILGLIVALTPPLRALFVLTNDPVASPDELPPLSFIHEVTLMLGGCCVPLGLTVLGASLSRLKPGRWRPLVPALTLVTIIKLVICPILGIYLVQRWLVHGWGVIDVHNHMLQFTLMLMSGSPTSIICFVLAQVWDKRSQNAGAEMAAVIAVQYAAGTVLITVLSAFMMYFLFNE